MNNKEIDRIAAEIIKHRDLYYNHQSIISDEEFDALIDVLKDVCPEHPAITNVGAPANEDSGWKKAEHQIIMGSLNKATTSEELVKWVKDTFTNCNSIFIIEKLDGSSIELIYEDGKLNQAITRGDGKIGELITANAIKMGGVKKKLPIPFTGSLRGEIILKRSKHEKHFSDLANVRNGANGIAKRLDGDGCEHLDILFYQAIGDSIFTTEYFQLQFLEKLGFNVPNYYTLASDGINTLIEFTISKWNEYQKSIRDSLDYEIDGLVVAVSDLRIQEALGETRLRPKGKIAFKFPGEEKRTRITAINLQTGNNGHITPVAEVEPVMLMGAEIKRASIYNFHNIQELGIGVGAEVMIKRGGDVIPVITSVISRNNTTFPVPTNCPACDGPVELRGKHLCCINTDTCIAQKNGRILNWVKELNILELGDALIHQLIDVGLVKSVADLYKLTIEQLSSLERMGEKSAANVYKSIWSKNTVSLEMLFGGLSIPLVGAQTIKLIVDAGYDDLDKIFSIPLTALEDIKGLGPSKSNSLFNGIKNNKTLILELLELGLKIEDKKLSSSKLNGKSFVITGKTNVKRDVLRSFIEDNGGIYRNAVNAKTDFLIIADPNSTTTKAVEARDMGVKLISEEEFLSKVK